MMMKRLKYLLLLLLLLPATLASRAENPGQWRIHNTWCYYTYKVIDTPARAFYLMRGQIYNSLGPTWLEDNVNLFVLDKETEELMPYNASNYLHGNIIQNAAYNAKKGYLMLVYVDSSIELLYDDDTTFIVPGLENAVLSSSKIVNNIIFDAKNNHAYLATDFGYLVIDDEKHVIEQSRIYNTKLNGIARVGDKLVAAAPTGVYTAPASGRNLSWSDFTLLPGTSGAVTGIIPCNDDTFAFVQSGLSTVKFGEDGTPEITKLFGDAVNFFHENKDGYFVHNSWFGNQLKADGTVTRIVTPEKFRTAQLYGSSWDMKTFYFSKTTAGLEVQKYDAENDTWTVQLDRPNDFVSPYKIFNADYSPKYGMVVVNEPYNRLITPDYMNYLLFAGAYDNNKWTNYGYKYSNSAAQNNLTNTFGAQLDPSNEDLMWAGSVANGLFSINLENKNVTQYTDPFPRVFSGYSYRRYIGKPAFDNDGTMWVGQNITGNAENSYNPLWYWKAEDRIANNKNGLKSIPIKGYEKYGAMPNVLPLKHPSNKNMLIYWHPTQWSGGFYILNHQGTLDDTSDDKVTRLTSFIDQRGASMASVFVNNFFEDPATGEVWAAASTGTFHFKPSELLGGKTTIERLIIDRNDGTNQGDYFLDGNDVYHISADGAGRLWFSTLGNGVVVLSRDQKQVDLHLTAENSLLPSNEVYVTAFDPTSNAVWIGNQYQLATYYSDVTPGAEDYSNVISYPNPVRPDFYGHVTIQGLMDDSLIKIIDQSGNLVKELGTTQGGMITWDLTNLESKRVSTGVYIIVSTNDTASSSVGKILVVK